MSTTRTPWPTYVPSDPDEGPGCGQAAHEAECLCDVVIPQSPPQIAFRRYAYSELAYDALRSRGNPTPTTLQLVRQMLGLVDAVADARVDLGPALEAVVDAKMARDAHYDSADWPDDQRPGLKAKAAENARRVATQKALKLAPAAVVASALGESTHECIGRAYRATPDQAKRIHDMGLEGATRREIRAAAHLEWASVDAILRAYRIPTPTQKAEARTAEIIRMATEGKSATEIARTLGADRHSIKRIIFGKRGPLHSIRVRVEELRALGWTPKAIQTEIGCSAALVGRICQSATRIERARTQSPGAIMTALAEPSPPPKPEPRDADRPWSTYEIEPMFETGAPTHLGHGSKCRCSAHCIEVGRGRSRRYAAEAATRSANALAAPQRSPGAIMTALGAA